MSFFTSYVSQNGNSPSDPNFRQTSTAQFIFLDNSTEQTVYLKSIVGPPKDNQPISLLYFFIEQPSVNVILRFKKFIPSKRDVGSYTVVMNYAAGSIWQSPEPLIIDNSHEITMQKVNPGQPLVGPQEALLYQVIERGIVEGSL